MPGQLRTDQLGLCTRDLLESLLESLAQLGGYTCLIKAHDACDLSPWLLVQQDFAKMLESAS